MQFLSGLETVRRKGGARSVLRLFAIACSFAMATGSGFAGVSTPTGFYVAPNGKDSNPGTLEEPVATLARAQQLMRAGTVKTTYLRAGVYALPVAGPKACNFGSTDAALALTAEDNGETWSYYPPDGYDTAVLDGQSTKGSSGTGGGNGMGCAFAGKSIHDVHIVGLRFKRFLSSALFVDGGKGLSFADNIVQDFTAAVFASGGTYLHCVSDSTIRDNAFFNLAYMGVALGADAPCTAGISNDIISGNVVLNTCLWPARPGGNDQDGGDCGGIYVMDRTTASTGVQIINNFTRDVNIVSKDARDWGNCCAFGVYLDDGASNTVVKGNVVAGSMTSCFMIHGGEKNDFRGNLCDLGVEGTQGIVTAGTVSLTKMSGNGFHNNLVIAGSNDPGLGFVILGQPIESLAIANNAYFNYAGHKVFSKGTLGSDAHPVYRDPQLSSWTYTLAKESPIFDKPVSFAGIPTTWGPPGFVIPQNGTPPSYIR